MSFLCVACTTSDDEVSFDTLKDLKAHESGGHRSRPKKELPPSEPPKPSATEKMEEKKSVVVKEEKPVWKPLELTYKWTGSCPTCNTEVKTIDVDLGEKWMIICWCIACDKKLKQKEVVPIEKEKEPDQSVYPIHKLRGRPKK